MPDKDFVLSSDGLKNLNVTKSDESDKTVIGQGKTLADLKSDAMKSVVQSNNPANTKSPVVATSSNPIPPAINHSDNLIKILSNSFSNHRERINAENKIRAYFNGLEK